MNTQIETLKMQHDTESDHTNRGVIDSQIATELYAIMDANNPRKLPRNLVSQLISADRCARCLGELDTGWECNDCGHDWMPWIGASRALHEFAHNNREG